MEKIGVGTFGDCSSLEIVHFPSGISKIDSENPPFDGCRKLKVIYVPANKADYYKRRLPKELCKKIVELENEK